MAHKWRFSAALGWAARHKLLAALGGVVVLVIGVSAAEGGGHERASQSTSPVGAGPAALPPTASTAPTPTARPLPPAPRARAATAARGSALALLATLPVKGRAPKTGYAREMFGQAWADTNRNGCDTRNDILRRDLTGRTLKAGTHGCVVTSGALADPYTGRAIHFVRGGASEVDIDHVVALSNAWQTGAGAWPSGKRLAFANDPLNLLAVDASANRQKGDGDAATWLPSNKTYRCAYLARQVAVKARYRLWVVPPERDAMRRVLSTCPTLTPPVGTEPTIAPIRSSTGSGTSSSPAAAPTGGLDPRYGTCAEAKSHGYGPYVRGKDPEYAWYIDRDSDGIDCE